MADHKNVVPFAQPIIASYKVMKYKNFRIEPISQKGQFLGQHSTYTRYIPHHQILLLIATFHHLGRPISDD